MVKTKKVISLVLVILMCLSVAPFADLGIKANATSKSQDEAIIWAQSQLGKSIDTDGFPSDQPYQCVDFIKSYYSFLGVTPVNGNGSDYTWNNLPSGWQRLQGVQPQKGDILVYTGGYNNYGHVAIYESDRVHYHQNIDNHYYVTKATYRYNGLSTPYWGVIRPNWSTPTTPTNYFKALWHGDVGETNARIDATIDLTYIQQCGFYYGKSSSNMTRVVENTYANTINIWFNFNEYGITLSPGTTYYYKIFIIVNGVEYQTATQYFTTAHSHSYSSSVTTAPTCDETGIRTYKCSCGHIYTETIAELGHSISDEFTVDKAPTCTTSGVKSRHCTRCDASAYETYMNPTDHIPGEFIVTKESTCTEEGEEKQNCTECGKNLATQNIEKKDHTEVIDKAITATCTKTGLTEGKHCSVCDTIIVAQNVVDAKGHKDNNFDGKCDDCGISSSAPDMPDAPDEPAKDCTCNCHKSGLAGLFFKIINFFQKLFGQNKVCTCGVKH